MIDERSAAETIAPRASGGHGPPAPVREEAVRRVIGGRYVLLEEIGRGGFGVVHLSWDLVLRRVVAIKLLREGNVDAQFLRREAAIAIDLTHDGIVRVHHFEPPSEGLGPFMVMEYLPWSTGEGWIADAGSSGIPARSVLAVGVTLCEALAYAHAKRVLHLDIKPRNIFVEPGGEAAKLADFGLARVLAGRGTSALQMTLAGTPAYMAPEQKIEGGTVSPMTDVYQLAATLWDSVAGEPPRGDAAKALPPHSKGRVVLEVVRAALASDPGARPSAQQFGEMLRVALRGA